MAGNAPEWPPLLKLARSKNPAERCHAVTQAQSALERLLSAHDYRREGEPFHASVSLAANEFGLELPDDLKDIIRLRNQIAHEGHIPGMLEAEDAVEVFQTAFQRLAGALEGPRRRSEAGQRTSSRTITRRESPRTDTQAGEARARATDRSSQEMRGQATSGRAGGEAAGGEAAAGPAARRAFVAVEGSGHAGTAWSTWTEDEVFEDREPDDPSDFDDEPLDDAYEDERQSPLEAPPARTARTGSSTASDRASEPSGNRVPPSRPAPDRAGEPSGNRVSPSRPAPDRAGEPPPSRRTSPSRPASDRAGEPAPGSRAAPPRSIVVPPPTGQEEGRPSTGWARVKEGGRDVAGVDEESPAARTRSRRKSAGRAGAADPDEAQDQERGSSRRSDSDTPPAVLYFGYGALTWLVAGASFFAYELYLWAAPVDPVARAGWIVLGLLAGALVAVVAGIVAWPVLALAGLIGVGCLTGGLVGGAVGAAIGALIAGREGAQTGAEIGGLILGGITSSGLIARHYLTILFLRFK